MAFVLSTCARAFERSYWQDLEQLPYRGAVSLADPVHLYYIFEDYGVPEERGVMAADEEGELPRLYFLGRHVR